MNRGSADRTHGSVAACHKETTMRPLANLLIIETWFSILGTVPFDLARLYYEHVSYKPLRAP